MLSLRELGIRSAFDGYLRDPGGVIGAAFENRYEVVGCLAPFFHLRIAPTISGFSDAFQIWTLPVTAAIGISATDDTSIYVQYGIAFRSVGTDQFTTASGRNRQIEGTLSTQRVRLGFDWHAADHLHIGASIEYASVQDGIFGALYVMGGGDP
jgi:opacity protein-like surface antigen